GSPLSMGDSFVLTVQPVADPPEVVGATTVANVEATGLTVLPNPVDGPEVTYFRITNIINGSLFLNNGTPITDGQFIGVGQGVAGLRFTPSQDLVGHRQLSGAGSDRWRRRRPRRAIDGDHRGEQTCDAGDHHVAGCESIAPTRPDTRVVRSDE